METPDDDELEWREMVKNARQQNSAHMSKLHLPTRYYLVKQAVVTILMTVAILLVIVALGVFVSLRHGYAFP